MNILFKILCNTLVVSLPEEIFITMIIYMFSNSQLVHNMLQMKFKVNKGFVIFPALASALVSNIVIFTGYQDSILSLLAPIVLIVLIIYINIVYQNRNNNIKIVLNSFKGLVVGFFGIAGTNLSLMLLTKFLGGSIKNLSLILNIMYSIPINLIYLVILFIILPIYSREVNIKEIFMNNRNQRTMFAFITLSTILMITGFKLIIYDQMFRNHEEIAILSLLSIPIITLVLIIYKIYKRDYNIKLQKFDELYK